MWHQCRALTFISLKVRIKALGLVFYLVAKSIRTIRKTTVFLSRIVNICSLLINLVRAPTTSVQFPNFKFIFKYSLLLFFLIIVIFFFFIPIHLSNHVHFTGNPKVVLHRENGDYDVIEYSDFPTPKIESSHDIIVKNSYAGVNFIEAYFRKGIYKASLPYVFGRS